MTIPYSASNESSANANSGAGGGIGDTTFYFGGNPNLANLMNNKTLQYALIAGAAAVVLFLLWKRG